MAVSSEQLTLPNLVVPDGISLVYLPPYTPEIQPAERLWPLVDEPVANRFFDTIDDLDEVIAQRCRVLHKTRDLAARSTHFHWWPMPVIPT